MKFNLGHNDIILSGGVLAGLEYSSPLLEETTGIAATGLDKEAMLKRLRENPQLALELLSTGHSHIYYMGNHKNARTGEGKSLGVKFVDGGSAVEGDNIYGNFLYEVREAYLQELNNRKQRERVVRKNQVKCDFVPAGSNLSHVESLEEEGKKFIHVDSYKPVRYKRNSAMDGTTGYAQRQSDTGVSFQTFVCPFGLDSKSKVRVGSAAEMSYLYEQALREELDWKSLFRTLQKRGIMKAVSEHDQSLLITDLKAQFSWMREQIIKNSDELSQLTIIGEGNLVPDNSFGRSVYDAELAPSPAHVLARYVNNPFLFFTTSENQTLKALNVVDKNEPYRFSAVNGTGTVTIVVDGSDTIGGRRPGTRAVKEKNSIYARDSKGNIIYDLYGDPVISGFADSYKFDFKSKQEIEAEYLVFSQRMDAILANISEDVPVRFVSGKGIGTPQMLKRYVEERGGKVGEWDYLSQQAVNLEYKQENKVDSKRTFELLRMPGFNTVLPVILGEQKSVDILVDYAGTGSEIPVTFKKKDAPSPSGYVTFSDEKDARFRSLLNRGSLAGNAGLPVIHVQNNASEDTQKQSLECGVSVVRSMILGDQDFNESLFPDDRKNVWAVDQHHLLYHDRETGTAIPYVMFLQGASVYVNNVPFRSVYAAYAALLLSSNDDVAQKMLYELSRNESSAEYVSKIVSREYPDDVRERCMRNAVHMMCQSSSSFADSLLSTSDAELVMCSSYGGNRDFVDLDGKGENWFGVVLMAERSRLQAELNEMRQKAEEEAMRIAEDNNRLQKRANATRAPGEKHKSGLPQSIEASADGIWMVGTSRPSRLTLGDDQVSFIQWEEREYGKDALNRELASRAFLDDGEGGEVKNEFIFLFPTDLQAVLGTRHVKNNPDSKDLTGVTRINPETGQVFTCAFGIPVKKDNLYFERDNKQERPCSYRLDNDSSDLVNSIISTDALARSTALRENMSLCYSIRQTPLKNGDENDDLSRVFNDKIWDYPRTKEVIDHKTGKIVSEAGVIMPTEVRKKVYNSETRKYEEKTEEVLKKTWVDNPHAAPRNKTIMKRYQSVLKEGATLPLNCICLPKTDYTDVPEEQFLADFSFVLSLMNATALATDKPMRFPLDNEGRLYLGPDIPDRYRDMAERKLDSFIGVVKDEDIINGPLPYISRIPVSSAFKNDIPLKGDGSDIYLRPNDLMIAFGPYNFNKYMSTSIVPIHEMAFVTDDGTVFKVTGNRFSHNLTTKESNAYYKYVKNDEVRFSVKSSNPERIPEFINVLKSYVERAKRVKTEFRLVTEEEAVRNFEAAKEVLIRSGYSEAQAIEGAGGTLDLDGFVNLLSSNSDKSESDVGDVAARGPETALDIEGRDFNDTYHGKEDAKDGFKGYVEYQYTLPSGTKSAWRIVRDTELAKDIIMANVKRVYRPDVQEIVPAKVLDARLKSYAIKDAGDLFRSLSQEVVKKVVDTKIVDTGEPHVDENDFTPPVVEKKHEPKVYVTYYGSRAVPADSFKVRMSTSCPEGMKDDIDVDFESLYPDFKSMVGPHKNGEIDDAEYTRRYVSQVLQPNKDKIIENFGKIKEMAAEEGKDVYLFCYCKPGNFCHRYLVNNFLNENGISCQELPADRIKYNIGRVPLYGEPNHKEGAEIGEAPRLQNGDILEFTRSSGQYSQRTYENANADDVTFTLAFATDFTTAGERCTLKAAGTSCITVDLPLKEGGGLDISKNAVYTAVQSIKDCLPDEFMKGEPCGFNIAGNGIYTLNKSGIVQEDLDNFIAAVMQGLKENGMRICSLRSGGQTGVDEAAAAAGFVLGVKTIINAPFNWAFRGKDNIDIKGDEKRFRERFERKDYASIKKWVKKTLSQSQERKKKSEVKR